MKKMTILILLLISLVTFFNCNTEKKKVRQQALQVFSPLPDSMPEARHDSKDLIALGKKLYFEKRLSINDSQACNSCHLLDKGGNGVDNQTTSTGALGKKGGRNSPTVFNAGLHISQFWDGRAKDLTAQAKGPILNPIEMGMPSEKAVVAKLEKIEEYRQAFASAFPNEKKTITYDNLANAIAAFERTLITRDRFDNFLKGSLSAISNAELEGLQLFMKTGCASCHSGALLGGRLYQKVGIVAPYPTEDLGRYSLTKKDTDKFVFKVPSLRNIANTAPYFHDGKVPTLEQAIETMAKIQLGKNLDDHDIAAIATFLKSLSKK